MYLSPGNLWKDFFVEKDEIASSSRGRVVNSYGKAEAKYFVAILAGAQPTEMERFRQLGHPITHTITHKGHAKAAAGDRLVHSSRVFYVQGVDDPGELGAWTLYYAEERSDIHGDSSHLEQPRSGISESSQKSGEAGANKGGV